MSPAIYMVEFHLNLSALFRFLQTHAVNKNTDIDLGYGTHAWLSGTFGDLGPKPFRLLQGKKGRPPRLLGYTSVEKNELLERAQEFASPAALSVCDLQNNFHSKKMPDCWENGRRLGFKVLTCPVSRKDGVEKDVFLRAADRVSKEQILDRAAVYREWLANQLKNSATIEKAELESFQMVPLFRRGTSKKPGNLVRPRAEFSGVLEIVDGENFVEILARGVGRHRAFGYGMLLLSPAP